MFGRRQTEHIYDNGYKTGIEPRQRVHSPIHDRREKIWVRKEVEKIVVPERKDARAGARVTKARSKEAKNTGEAMSREGGDNRRNRRRQKKSCWLNRRRAP